MAQKASVYGEPSINQQFFDLYDRMIGDVHIPSVLRNVADVVCQDLNAERASIYLIDPNTQELEAAAVIGNVAKMIRIPIEAGSLAGFCALTGTAYVVPDAYADLGYIDPRLRFDRSWDEINRFRTRDVMCAPAFFKEKIMGVVQVLNSKGQPFHQTDLVPLQNIARLIGYALYHAKLYDDVVTLKRLDKEKAEFSRIMVHELKSPIAAAKMMADTLMMPDMKQEQIFAFASRIADRIDDMNQLIKDILELASVKSGSPIGEVSILDLNEQTVAAYQTYQEQAQSKGLELEISLPSEPVPIRFDTQGCKLLLSNLLSNAVKYTKEGSVRVQLSRQDSWAVLEVSDTGIGIPEKEIPNLFREFFRASNAKRNRIQGSGVGLAGVKQMVERFNGEMQLQSRENEGSTFIVRLPIHMENK